MGKSSLYLVKPAPISRHSTSRGLTLCSLTFFLSRAPCLSTVPRQSAAILYIAKSFTISLGTFIILQLNLPCFAAGALPRGRFNLSFHLSPGYLDFSSARDRPFSPRFVPRSSSQGKSRILSVVTRSYFPIRPAGESLLPAGMRGLIRAVSPRLLSSARRFWIRGRPDSSAGVSLHGREREKETEREYTPY